MSVIKGIDLPINNLGFKYSHILVLYNQLSNTEQTNMEMIHTEHAVKKNEGRWTTEENYLFDKCKPFLTQTSNLPSERTGLP